MTTSIIDTVKGKIEYSMVGEGKAILIVHGGHVNCKETIFQKGLDVNKFCLITPSRPGYGNTPLTRFNKTPEGTADLFIALLDALNIPNAIVMGISAGGLTALEIAVRHPNRVSKLVLMSALTKKWLVETDKLYIGGKKAFAPGMEKFTWLLYKLLFNLMPAVMTRVMFKEISIHRPVEFTDNEIKELKQMTMRMRSGQGFSNDLDQTIDQESLSRIVCSTLILHSENDNAVDLSHPNNAKSNISNAQLMTFKNRWGHLLWIGAEYDPILSVLKKYIDK
jgi:pimeloyl-ACP methyl ester carboxylesterase